MRFLPLIATLLLAACGPGDNDPGPGGVTMSEARELNEAAAMLEPDSVTANTLDNGTDQP